MGFNSATVQVALQSPVCDCVTDSLRRLGRANQRERYLTMNSSNHVYMQIQAEMKAMSTFLASTAGGGRTGTRYKFRAECLRDAQLFFAAISEFSGSYRKIIPLDFGDVEGVFELSCDISPRDLLWAASRIVDGHVAAQTLELEVNYTGERDYDRYLDEDDPDTMPSAATRSAMRRGAKAYVKQLRFLLDDAKEFASSI